MWPFVGSCILVIVTNEPTTPIATPTAEQVRDRAYDILVARGVDPFDAHTTVWSAACETARSDLLVEAARLRRTWTVWCPDGEVRHPEPFATQAEALTFAEWGHCCTAVHTHRIAPTV